jgi:tRNA A-37 threonylcarbamoyl transferase component Bud32
MRFRRLSRVVLATAISGLVFTATPSPSLAQTDSSATGSTAAHADDEYETLMAEIDSVLGRAAEPAEQEPAPGLEPGAETRTEPTPERATAPPQMPSRALRERIESGANRILAWSLHLVPAEPDRILTDLRAEKWTRDAEIALLDLLVAVLLALFIIRKLRGHGDVSVSIHYPADLRGTFNVRISKRKSPISHQRFAKAMDPDRARREASAASRFEHTMVAREAHFRDLQARSYVVMVYGYLQPLNGEKILATHLAEQEVRIRRGHTERLDFDFHPSECTLEVNLVWERRPVTDALIAIRGAPGSLRYARGAVACIALARGTHVLVVGSGDRVMERELDITSYQPINMEIDLGSRDHILFSGCPPAVEPYLHGDLAAAARILERDGQSKVAHLILARLHHERGQNETAAEHYEACEHQLEAAEIHGALNRCDRAAELFEEAGEPARAGEMWRADGQYSKAGEAYERANRLDTAVDCYREAEDISRWTATLDRQGLPLEAAQVAVDHDDWERAIRSLQQVAHADPNYDTASNLLVDAYQRAGHIDLALNKIEELVNAQGIDAAPLESCDWLAQLLEENGQFDRSLNVLETLRRRDADYPNVSTRIETLKKRANEEATTGAISAAAGVFGEGSRYEILTELGRGGMGVVCRARDLRLGRIVALKRLPDNLRNHPKAVQLFLREARSAAALNHPNIVTIYDAGQEDGTLYITMELLEGTPLQEILKSRGRLTVRDTARLGMQIAKGLQYAHEHQIIHRDIKTGNLFFTASKKVKIMDFGLAKMVQEVRRGATVIGGTPYYMAPEQSIGDAVDHRADLYSLGITLFELATGCVPFTEGDIAYHHRHTPPPDPRELIPSIPAELAELILQLLAKDPGDRCQTAQEVSDRLQPFSVG